VRAPRTAEASGRRCGSAKHVKPAKTGNPVEAVRSGLRALEALQTGKCSETGVSPPSPPAPVPVLPLGSLDGPQRFAEAS
jgi:hypothetical protein